MIENEYVCESKWEYKSFHCFLSFTEYRVNNAKGTKSIEVSKFLNRLGQEGWELVSTMQKTTDYEPMVGGSGHPVGIKAHKNTGYEVIMKRQLVKATSLNKTPIESKQDILSLLERTSTIGSEIEQAILDTSDMIDDKGDVTDNMSIEDLTEVSRRLEPDNKRIKAPAEDSISPLLGNPFYSSDSSTPS